jgi:hypothetical protein
MVPKSRGNLKIYKNALELIVFELEAYQLLPITINNSITINNPNNHQ